MDILGIKAGIQRINQARKEVWRDYKICSQMRGMRDSDTYAAWTLKIRSTGDPVQLRQMAQELIRMTDYSGSVRFGGDRAAIGKRDAGILLQSTLERIWEKDFMEPMEAFDFPFANDGSTAALAVNRTYDAMDGMVRRNLRMVLESRPHIMNMALRNIFDMGLTEVYGPKGREAEARRTFKLVMDALPEGAQSVFLLKLLEWIEAEKRPLEDRLAEALGGGGRQEAQQAILRNRLEEGINAALKRLPVGKFAELAGNTSVTAEQKSEQATAAMFFMFRQGPDELDGSRFTYIFELIKQQETPSELVTQYLLLGSAERHNLFALKDNTPPDLNYLRSKHAAGWHYNNGLVENAIRQGEARRLEDIINLGRKGRFFVTGEDPLRPECYRPKGS